MKPAFRPLNSLTNFSTLVGRFTRRPLASAFLASLLSFALPLVTLMPALATAQTATAGSAKPARNLYEILDVKSAAGSEEIKTAWKKLVRLHHPDRFMGDSEAIQRETTILAEVNAAEQILGDKDLRAYYDYLSNGGQDHARWDRVPGNNNLKDLARRFGPVESLRQGPAVTKNPFGDAAPNARADSQGKGPRASRTQSQNADQNADSAGEQTAGTARGQTENKTENKSEPKTRKQWSNEELLALLADGKTPAANWKAIFAFYTQRLTQGTDLVTEPVPQEKILALLFDNESVLRSAEKSQALAMFIATKFRITDTELVRSLNVRINRADAAARIVGIELVETALTLNRTSEIFNEPAETAKNFLIKRLSDRLPEVRARAAQTLGNRSLFSPAEELALREQQRQAERALSNVMVLIAQLDGTNEMLKTEALQKLFVYQNLEADALKALVHQIMKRQRKFDVLGDNKHLVEILGLLQIIERSPDRGGILRELEVFARFTGSLRLQQMARNLIQTSVSPPGGDESSASAATSPTSKFGQALTCEGIFR